MRGLFVAGDPVGDSNEVLGVRLWCIHESGVHGYAGAPVNDNASFAGYVFAESQATLDAIEADGRTTFAIPLAITDKQLSWESDSDLPSSLFGKIVAWVAANGLHKLSPDKRNPARIAQHIMDQLVAKPGLDPLLDFLVGW